MFSFCAILINDFFLLYNYIQAEWSSCLHTIYTMLFLILRLIITKRLLKREFLFIRVYKIMFLDNEWSGHSNLKWINIVNRHLWIFFLTPSVFFTGFTSSGCSTSFYYFWSYSYSISDCSLSHSFLSSDILWSFTKYSEICN